MPYHVFISYRRDGGAETARLLYYRLKQDGYEPFLDVEQMRSGKFNTQLYDRIAECDDFLLILSPRALERCRQKNDWVRAEIMEAIRNKKRITPFVLRNFSFPKRKRMFFGKAIPPEILDIETNQGVVASDDYFDSAYEKLKKYLKYKPQFYSGLSSNEKQGDNKDAEKKMQFFESKRKTAACLSCKVAAGGDHIVGVRKNNTVFAEGNNWNEQCNTSGWTDVIAVSCGKTKTLGLKKDGSVLSTSGDFGLWHNVIAMDSSDSNIVLLIENETVVPFCLPFLEEADYWEGIIAVSVGEDHLLGLKRDGTVVADGKNDHGQCAVSGWSDIVAIAAGDGFSVGLKKDGTVVATGSNDYLQCEVTSWKEVVYVSAGSTHTVGLKMDGTVVATGRNNNRQCDVSFMKNIISVKADKDFTFAVTEEGHVISAQPTRCFCWYNISAISAGPDFCLGLRKDGTVVSAGLSRDEREQITEWNKIVAISAGNDFAVALKKDGTAECFQKQNSGSFSGTKKNKYRFSDCRSWQQLKAVSAGSYYIMGITNDGKVLLAGDDELARIKNVRNLIKTEDCPRVIFGLKRNGRVIYKGYIHEGRSKRELRSLRKIVSISARKNRDTSFALAALRNDGTVECIQDIGTIERKSGLQIDTSHFRKIVAVAMGYSHVLGLEQNGTVVAASTIFNLDRDYCNVSGWKNIVAVAAGDGFSLGLKDDGFVIAEGDQRIRDIVMGFNLFK